MIKVSKRFADRAKSNIRRYQKILESARTRDVGETDTVVIVADFLTDVLGYDKYEDVTTEFAVRSTFCDLAVKRGDRVQFLIEVKSVGTDLRDNHLRQATDYGANQGVEWVLLTNGIVWRAYRIRFEQPISHDHVFTVDLLDSGLKPQQLIDRLYLISKEAGGEGEIDRFWRHKEAMSRYVVAQLLLDSSVLTVIRRQLRTLYPGLKVTEEEIGELLRTEVLKRDALEGDKATAAGRAVRKSARKRLGGATKASSTVAAVNPEEALVIDSPSGV
jgi:predicted type IV restriction endonuclease